MTEERTTAWERYMGGLESLLSLEIQTEALIPTMAAYAGCERLRRFFEDLPPMVRRQRRRLELLLNAFPDRTDTETTSRNGLQEDLRELGGMYDPADRDAELVNSAAWIISLQIEQYGATRELAMQLGDVEAARHLERSLNTAGALSLRLFRISQRIRHVSFGFHFPEASDFDRLPALTGALP